MHATCKSRALSAFCNLPSPKVALFSSIFKSSAGTAANAQSIPPTSILPSLCFEKDNRHVYFLNWAQNLRVHTNSTPRSNHNRYTLCGALHIQTFQCSPAEMTAATDPSSMRRLPEATRMKFGGSARKPARTWLLQKGVDGLLFISPRQMAMLAPYVVW